MDRLILDDNPKEPNMYTRPHILLTYYKSFEIRRSWPELINMRECFTVYGVVGYGPEEGLAESLKDFDSAEEAQQYLDHCEQAIAT